MLKNDIRYIIKRVLVAVLIAFILFFLKSHHVLAATVGITQSNYQFGYMFCMYRNGQETCSDFDTTGYSNFGVWNNFTSDIGVTGSGTYVVTTYARSYATLTTGNTYSYTFRTQYNPKDFDLNQIGSWNYNIYANVGSNLSDSYVFNQSCSSRNIQTHDYAVETTCTFQVNTNASYVLVRTTNIRVPRVNITFSNAAIQSSQSEVGAITEQTTVIKQEFEKIISIINNFNNSEYEYLTDDSDAAVDVSGMTGITTLLPPGPVDSLLTLPLTLIQILISNTSGTCIPFTFTFVFNQQFTLPCFDDFWNQVPNSMMLFLSDLPAVYIFIKWAKSVYKRVERATMFESSVDDEWGGV